MSTSNKYLVEEYQGRINRVMDYIEQNMDKSFSLEELADVANFSKYHFNRIFWAMTGETPFVFLQRIRMERAATLLLISPRETVSGIAFQCGFSSLPVFSRNFRQFFHMSPTQWRARYLPKDEVVADMYGNIRQAFRNQGKTPGNDGQMLSNDDQSPSSSERYFSEQYEPLKWRTNMELNKGVEIQDFPKTTIAYVRHTGPYAGDEKLFERLYGELFAWAGPRGLTTQPDLKTYNVYHDDPNVTDEQKLRVSVGINVPPDTRVDGQVGKMELQGGKYAVARFELTSMDYEKAWSWLFGEWFPASGFQPADAVCFEMYSDQVEGDTHKVEICVPVKTL